MKRYKLKINEIVSGTGTIEMINANINDNKSLMNEINKLYFKQTGKEIGYLKPWVTNAYPARYDIVPDDAEERQAEVRQALGTTGTMIWDTIDISYDFNNKTLFLNFSGYKLKFSAKFKY